MFGLRKRDKSKSKNRAKTTDSSGYLRRKTPVRVRPGFMEWTRTTLRWVLLAVILASLGLSTAYSIDTYLSSDSRFFLSAEAPGLALTGLQHLSPEVVGSVFELDLGRSVADIPLEERHRQLQKIPWVERASVLRIWPNRLWVHIEERRPVAFVRVAARPGSQPEVPKLIDAAGVFLEPPPGVKFSLPVITGVTEVMPYPDRQSRVAVFQELVRALDGEDPPYSRLLSEIDVADPRNARVTTLHDGNVIELQLGEQHFRHRFGLFLKYIDSWKQEFGQVRSVDLRFEGHVAVK